MSNTIEAIFDGKVFRPESEVELKPNTRIKITVMSKAFGKIRSNFASEAGVWVSEKIWITTKRAN